MSDENFSSSDFGTPYRTLVDYCETNGLKFRADDASKSVCFTMRCDAAPYDVVMMVTHDDEVFQIYVVMPVGAGTEKLRHLITEFVARANHRIVIGHFDWDVDEGGLRYHVGHALGDRGLDDETIGRLMATALNTADRYFPALMQVMFAGHTPADAVYLAELDVHVEEVEDTAPTPKPSTPSPKAAKPPAKKKPRRPRRDPRLKSTHELPGLFEGKTERNEKKNPTSRDDSSKPK